MLSGFALFAAFAVLAACAGAALMWSYRRAGGARAAPVTIVAGASVLAAFAIYVVIGRPDLPDAPYQERIAALKARPAESYTDAELLARLAAEARAHPDDARPHLATGVILAEQRRFEEAARAFDAALRRDPDSTFAMLNLARVLVALDQGRVSENAQRLFAAVAEAQPDDPTPWLYQALAATQEGRGADAGRLWREVKRRLPAGDPRHAMADRMIAESGG